ncbi:hypothetical protein ACWGCW_00830 [Streptomyces sp. NPDC054933]
MLKQTFKAIFGIETPAPRPQALAITARPYEAGALKKYATSEPATVTVVSRPYQPGALKTLAHQLSVDEGGE